MQTQEGGFSGDCRAWQDEGGKSPGLCGTRRLQRGKLGRHVCLVSLLDSPQNTGASAWLVLGDLPVPWSLSGVHNKRHEQRWGPRLP